MDKDENNAGRIVAEGRPLDPADIADVIAGTEAVYRSTQEPSDETVAVVDGAGVKVRVHDGHLVLADGLGWMRRERTYNRATANLRRVVVLADSGAITLAALRWCHEAGVSVVVMDDGEVVLAEGPTGTVDARLLRVQAAPPEGLAVEVARTALGSKMTGQARLARTVLGSPATADTIEALAAGVEMVNTVDEARQLEASAANVYFAAWAANPATALRFAKADAGRVPAHWVRFTTRRSPLAGNANRKAADPLNAMLNLCYTLAAVETRLALVTIGLHPALGFVHLDEPGRDNLAMDLVECVRPEVDSFVLSLVAQRTFRRGDFTERSDGSVRIAPALVGELAAEMPRWARAVAPHAERLRRLLGSAVEGKFRATQPLSGTARKAAAAEVKVRKVAATKAVMATLAAEPRPAQPTLWSCPDCGSEVTNRRHVRCLACQAKDPRQTPEVRSRRGSAIAARKARQAAWEAAGGVALVDPEWYATDVLPALADVKLVAIVAATGWSKSYASVVRRGRYIPHVSTWPALAVAAGVTVPGPD